MGHVHSTPEATTPTPTALPGWAVEGSPAITRLQRMADAAVQRVPVGGGDAGLAPELSAAVAEGSAAAVRPAGAAPRQPVKSPLKIATREEVRQILPEQVAAVDGNKAQGPKAILKNGLDQSWHEAKNILLQPAPEENAEARQLLMRKLWTFRKWHHNHILKKTQAEVGTDGLSKWLSAGSETLTSDIDVNLKGADTENAVAVFNRKFREDGWDKEAGVVYDVNVYALDFMHFNRDKGSRIENNKVKESPFSKGDQSEWFGTKEGSRRTNRGGGISRLGNGREMIKEDASNQRAWSLVKMRLHMSGKEWNDHVKFTSLDSGLVEKVNTRYNSYLRNINEKIFGAEEVAADAIETEKSGSERVDDMAARKVTSNGGGDVDEVKMNASNRLYEGKLKTVSSHRVELQKLLRELDSLPREKTDEVEAKESEINEKLVLLRDLVSECAMYSNEAYITDGAVNHAVVGLQQKIGIVQHQGDSMNAFNENVGDAIKEVKRHSGTLGEAAYKAGKYLWRMADAARNMNMSTGHIEKLYTAGFIIANRIKGKDSMTQTELEGKSQEQLIMHTGVKNVEQLLGYIQSIARSVTLKYQKKGRNLDRSKQVSLPSDKDQRYQP